MTNSFGKICFSQLKPEWKRWIKFNATNPSSSTRENNDETLQPSSWPLLLHLVENPAKEASKKCFQNVFTPTHTHASTSVHTKTRLPNETSRPRKTLLPCPSIRWRWRVDRRSPSSTDKGGETKETEILMEKRVWEESVGSGLKPATSPPVPSWARHDDDRGSYLSVRWELQVDCSCQFLDNSLL